jgi:DNA-binding XRE family transcriptional regulator
MRCSPVGEPKVPINNVQRFRERLMMSKAELARKAGLSTLTIDRVEAGRPCRLDTKRKVLLALGFKVSDKDRVFGLGALVAEESASTPHHAPNERTESA